MDIHTLFTAHLYNLVGLLPLASNAEHFLVYGKGVYRSQSGVATPSHKLEGVATPDYTSRTVLVETA